MITNYVKDDTEAVAGYGFVKNEQILGKCHFTVYGAFRGLLTNKNISQLSRGVGRFSQHVMHAGREEVARYADVVELLVSVGMNCGLQALKTYMKNDEVNIACEYIIKLMKYCRMELGEKSNMVLDTSLESIISSFPVGRIQAKNMYANSYVTSVAELPKVGFDHDGARDIGYLLFYAMKASGADVLHSTRLAEAFEILGLKKGDLIDYQDSYVEDAIEKGMQIRYVHHLFDGVEKEKYNINPCYIQKVINKTMDYWPQGDTRIHSALRATSYGFEAYLGKNLDAAYNAASEVLNLISRGCKVDKDNVRSEFASELRKNYGSDINVDSIVDNEEKDYSKFDKE